MQKQNKICGLYAIAATTTIAHGENQSNLQFQGRPNEESSVQIFGRYVFINTFPAL